MEELLLVASGLSSVWSPFAGVEFTPELKQSQPQSPSLTVALPRLCNQRSSHSVMSDSFATPWTVARQAPLSVRFPRQEYWSGILEPFPPPGDPPHPGIEPTPPVSPTLQADSLPQSHQERPL